MALNPQVLGRNYQIRQIKAPSVRLCDEGRSTSTAYVDLITGTGAPSGGYGRDAGATLAYFRQDATDASTALYLSADGGTTWSATASASDIELAAATDITIAVGVATLTGAVHTLRGEGAAADDLDTISGMADAEVAWLVCGAEAITIRDASVGAGNIATSGDTSIVLATGDIVMAVRTGAVVTVTNLGQAAGIAPGHVALARGSVIVGNSGAQGSALNLSAARTIAQGDGTDVVATKSPTFDDVGVDPDAAANGTGVVATSEQLQVRTLLLTLTNTPVVMADNAGVVAYGSLKVADLPEGNIVILGAVMDLALTLSAAGINADWDGDVGLGTTAADNSAALATTEQDIIPTTATPQAVASATTAKAKSTSTESANTFDGTTTAIDIYLNLLVDDADHDVTTTPTDIICNGTIKVTYCNLGDIA